VASPSQEGTKPGNPHSGAAIAERVRLGGVLARSRTLGPAVAWASDRAESRPESLVRVALTAAGIPPSDVNLEVSAGGRRWRLDLAYRSQAVAVEYQGEHHRDLAQWRRDVTRRSLLEAAGWTVVEFAADDLRDLPGLVARVRAAVARSSHAFAR